jgi:hypothetical protein
MEQNDGIHRPRTSMGIVPGREAHSVSAAYADSQHGGQEFDLRAESEASWELPDPSYVGGEWWLHRGRIAAMDAGVAQRRLDGAITRSPHWEYPACLSLGSQVSHQKRECHRYSDMRVFVNLSRAGTGRYTIMRSGGGLENT